MTARRRCGSGSFQRSALSLADERAGAGKKSARGFSSTFITILPRFSARQALLRACLDEADTRSRGVDCDPLDLTLCLRVLADGQAQHTVLELCVDLLGINIGAKLERALELALPALAINRTVVFGFLFALERQQAIMEGHLDVFLLHAGQFGDELDLIIRLADLDMRPPATRPARSAGHWHLEVTEEVVEHAIHLATER